MKRARSTWLRGWVLCGLLFCAAFAVGLSPREARASNALEATSSGLAVQPTTAANGLQIVGNFSYQFSGNTVTVNVDYIKNQSSTRTTGTLRLALWAATSEPAREAAVYGYRLTNFATFSPLAPNYYYYNVVRSGTYTPPPDGTYWMVLVLDEYDPIHCAAADGFCLSDSAVFPNQRTFGAPPPPPGQLTMPSPVTFVAQQVGTQSAPITVTVTNIGGLPVTVSSVQGNDLTEFPGTTNCVTTIAAGASCTLTISFQPTAAGVRSETVAITSSGLGSPQTISISGTGFSSAPPPPGEAVAVEYYYAAWNFYFETAFPDEIAALDGGAFGGVWKRTGQTFNVWPAATNILAVPTCRFFSTIFDPKSSHFYTPFENECTLLKAGTAWQYEGIAFYIALADDNGLCPAGTIPLYRAYNNGMGGAPNHRYTTSLTVLNQMLAAGWLFEGNGNTKVFACVPQ